ncbi:MAG: hypothetical protein VZQ55_02040 [Ruminococcus sp.]|nr:hypothetical protein [Ruminococcus sp.]
MENTLFIDNYSSYFNTPLIDKIKMFKGLLIFALENKIKQILISSAFSIGSSIVLIILAIWSYYDLSTLPTDYKWMVIGISNLCGLVSSFATILSIKRIITIIYWVKKKRKLDRTDSIINILSIYKQLMRHIASYEREEIEPNVLEEECFKLLLYCKLKEEIVQDVLGFSIDKIHFLLQISDDDNEVICKFYYSKHSHRKANDVVKFTTKCIISDTYTLIRYDMQEKVVYLPSDYLGRIIPTSFYLPIFHISLGNCT